jgi:hypothetical protein
MEVIRIVTENGSRDNRGPTVKMQDSGYMRQLKGFGDGAEYLLAAADRAKKSHMDKRKAPILYSLGHLPWAAL